LILPRQLEPSQGYAPSKSALKSPPTDTSNLVSKSDLKEILDAQAKATALQFELATTDDRHVWSPDEQPRI